LGQAVGPDDMQWQTWPAATTSNNFIRRSERPDATNQIVGSIARYPFIAGEPIRELKLVKANGSGFMAAVLPSGMVLDFRRARGDAQIPQVGAGLHAVFRVWFSGAQEGASGGSGASGSRFDA